MDFVPLIVDFALLVQSAWSGPGKLGPNLIYPMKCIKERQPGPLANSIMEHSMALRRYERIAEKLSQGVNLPCVAVIDLDEVAHPVARNGYSTQEDFYGFICLLILLEVIVVFILQVLCVSDGGWLTLSRQWTTCALHSLVFFILAVFRGEDTHSLARQSNASTSGCAVLLHREFSLILTGSESTLEAIAESSFHRPHRDWTTDIPIYLLCELLLPYTVPRQDLNFILGIAGSLIHCVLLDRVPKLSHPPSSRLALIGQMVISWSHCAASVCSLLLVVKYICIITSSAFVSLQLVPPAILLFYLFLARVNSQNCPIRTAKLLDTLDRPPVRKWQFNTLAASATFQCLVLCRPIARPIESIDVLAYLDVLIPDQRDVWKAWKARVADRIVHQLDISFAPTIPTFGDERQVQLRDLLREAQSGHDTYQHFYLAALPGTPLVSDRSDMLAGSNVVISGDSYLDCLVSLFFGVFTCIVCIMLFWQ